MCFLMLITVAYVEFDVDFLGNVVVDFVPTQIGAPLTVEDVGIDALGVSGAFMVCVDMLSHGQDQGQGHGRSLRILLSLNHLVLARQGVTSHLNHLGLGRHGVISHLLWVEVHHISSWLYGSHLQ